MGVQLRLLGCLGVHLAISLIVHVIHVRHALVLWHLVLHPSLRRVHVALGLHSVHPIRMWRWVTIHA